MEKTPQMMNKIISKIRDKFNLIPYEENTYRLSTPYFHRINGDGYNIFLKLNNDRLILTDMGETINRLVESSDVTIDYIIAKISKITTKYGCKIIDNDIIIESDTDHISEYLNMYIHTLIAIDYVFE